MRNHREQAIFDQFARHQVGTDYGLFLTDFSCSASCGQVLLFFSWIIDTSATKVGQYPSFADLEIPLDNKYRKVLSEERFREFTRAIGLVSHGVGVGSFVYLRRILEDLEEEAHGAALPEAGWNEELYQKSRFEERLELLASKLPPFLTENRSVYGIMSKGIHELTEKECLEHFDMLRSAIGVILDDKLAKQQAEENRKKLKDQIGKVKGAPK